MIDKLKELIDRYEAAEFTVSKKMSSVIRERLHEHLTTEQLYTLRYIKNYGPCTSSELADTFCVGKSAITAIITRLTDKNLINRVRDEDDRRMVYLSLTNDGLTICEEMDKKITEVIGSYLVHFEPSEIISFIQTYEKLAYLMKQDDESGEEK